MMIPNGSNEGKACDAVLRYIEARDQYKRTDIQFPERAHHSAPVELVCTIGLRRYALEHTRIEPFAGHLQANAEAERHFGCLELMVAGKLPSENHFELDIPFGVFLGKNDKEVRPIQEALADWIIATAPTLPVGLRPYRAKLPVEKVVVDGVPFKVSLHRWKREGQPSTFQIKHIVSNDIEPARRGRLKTGYFKKLGKLMEWQKEGARTVLILEENDIQLTNHNLVGDALIEIEKLAPVRPDEVYLISTANSLWFLIPLRVNDTSFYDLPLEKQHWKIGSDTLDNITKSESAD